MDHIVYYNPTVIEFGEGENRVWTLDVVPYGKDFKPSQHWLSDEERFEFCKYLAALNKWQELNKSAKDPGKLTPSEESALENALNTLQSICHALPHPSTAYQKASQMVEMNEQQHGKDHIFTICALENLYYICLAYDTINTLPPNTIRWADGNEFREKPKSYAKEADEKLKLFRKGYAPLWGKSHPKTTGRINELNTLFLEATKINTTHNEMQRLTLKTDGSWGSLGATMSKINTIIVDATPPATSSSNDIVKIQTEKITEIVLDKDKSEIVLDKAE